MKEDMYMAAAEKRVFKCASCGHVFEEGASMRCPECRGRTLILEAGPTLKGRGCGGNCGGGCSCGCHH